ncbi:hypothetical protein RS030_7977 [Cryptosporidium xiaoi]|uniref:Micro-fibrillar-associated protein 1 C-terminal domain-containing protein n=1 Tax=Cryptosporidium xiaoi TaxID=659607 RepID=A0AAV9XTM0_9CRYT
MDWNPKFIPKRNRNTIIEEERRREDLNERIARDKRIKHDVCALNRSELDSIIQNEKNKQNKDEIVENNDSDKTSEYIKWKLRELKRLKREYLDHLNTGKK